MSESRAQASDQVTLVVFKDNLSSRTFQVPLGWISRLGLIASLFTVIFLASLFMAVKYYRAAAVGDPGRVRELEQQLGELRTAQGALQENLANVPTTSTDANSQEAPLPSGADTMPLVSFNKAQLFSAVPAAPSGTSDVLPAESTLPFKLTDARVAWQSNTLRVSYNIQYTNAAGGSQQGRIVMLARGPGAIHAYPAQVLQPAGADTLIEPLKGEYFSVSRFRAVRADFGPIADRSSIREVEIMIFNPSGLLLAHRRLPVEGLGRADISPSRTEKRTIPKAIVPKTSPSVNPPVAPSSPATDSGAIPGESTP